MPKLTDTHPLRIKVSLAEGDYAALEGLANDASIRVATMARALLSGAIRRAVREARKKQSQ